MKATPRCQQVVKRGADCDRIRSLLRLAQFIQVPIRRLGVENRLKSERTRESRGRKDRTQKIFSGLRQYETGWSLIQQLEEMTTYKKHMYTQTEIPESLRAWTITHCPPAPHSGKDITATQMGRPIQTQNHHSHPHPLLRIHFLPVPFYFFYFFFPLLFLPLCQLLFVPLFLS